MENNFGIVLSIIEKMKQIRFKKLFAVVPPELKVQFDQMQLKNTLIWLKIFGIVMVIFNILNFTIYLLQADKISQLLLSKLFFVDSCQLFIIILFLLLSRYFSKKGKDSTLWIMCYLFLILHFILLLYHMLFVEIFLALQLFFTTTFIYTFAADFKPKIFISFLVLWYLAMYSLITYKGHSFAFGSPQVFALNIFLIALIIGILIYISKVRIFINTHKINTLNEQLEALSLTDELTKLSNRRSLLNHMDMIWKQNRRLQLPLTVLMIDVDYFKKYNDSMGHLEGDNVLIAVARCIENQMRRDTDFVARFGGEEFVCILPFFEKDDALNFANDLVQKIENMRIPHPLSEHSKYVTASIGMATTIPDDHNSPTRLLDEADKALYMAKHAGRNRVVVGYSSSAINS